MTTPACGSTLLVARPVARPAVLTASWTFSSANLSVPQARHAIRAQLADWDLHHACEFAELLVSELVTNAVAHARGLVRLSVSAVGGRLRCEVEDASPCLPRARHARDDEECSRGLCLVQALSSGWGSTPTGGGKVVWFELPVPAAVDV
ncbi:ATP-binding protein [Nonomuraea turkmeniaca]|uniref:ATP-binding protein n=1 Tax=Nonomuraea turkmeniaca TaxID=103838 RepID=A0A5S4EVC3_9ACTN|nr:ATP-binding protein [Nonomuraea turkmeniaca]TMR07038.1 ATP-binding protein [Nonomuraea turkmeniaca]